MTLVSKEDFLAKDDANYIEIEVPSWGRIRVRSLSGAGRDRYLQDILQWEDGVATPKTEDSEALLLALTLVDEDGKLWFDNVEEGVNILRQKDVGALQTVFEAAMKLSGLRQGDVVEAAENLDETPNEEHGSD